MAIEIVNRLINEIITHEVTYRSSKQEITISTLGASIKGYRTIDGNGEFASIIMHYDKDDMYVNNPKFLGASIGPYAGRIYPPKLRLNKQTYELEANFLNHSNLHSGSSNIAFRNFDLKKINDHQVVFSLKIEDDQQFPGPITYKFLYTFREDGLRIDYHAHASKDAVMNITNHSYFNLSGDLKSSVLNHQLQIPASHYLELNENYIGIAKKPVKETPFDFRHKKEIRQGVMPLKDTPTKGIDHPFYLDKDAVISLSDPISKRTLKLTTSYPSLVVYTNNLPTPFKLNNQQSDRQHDAVCLEAQYIPNDVHFEKKPKSILYKGNDFHEYIDYQILIES